MSYSGVSGTVVFTPEMSGVGVAIYESLLRPNCQFSYRSAPLKIKSNLAFLRSLVSILYKSLILALKFGGFKNYSRWGIV